MSEPDGKEKEYYVTINAWITATSDREAAQKYEDGDYTIDGHEIAGYNEAGDEYIVNED